MYTSKLNNGLTVVARWNREEGVTAVTYANRSAAVERSTHENLDNGHETHVWQHGPVFYVVVDRESK